MNRAASFVDESLEAPLLAALGDKQYGCQAWASMGWRALRLRSAVVQLRALLAAEDWLVRQKAAAASVSLAMIRPAKALRHPEVNTREAAASALADLHGSAALDAL